MQACAQILTKHCTRKMPVKARSRCNNAEDWPSSSRVATRQEHNMKVHSMQKQNYQTHYVVARVQCLQLSQGYDVMSWRHLGRACLTSWSSWGWIRVRRREVRSAFGSLMRWGGESRTCRSVRCCRHSARTATRRRRRTARCRRQRCVTTHFRWSPWSSLEVCWGTSLAVECPACDVTIYSTRLIYFLF